MYLTLELSVKLSQFDLTVDVWRFFSAPHRTDQRPAERSTIQISVSPLLGHRYINKQIRGGGVFIDRGRLVGSLKV